MDNVFMYGFFGFAALSAVLGFAVFHLYSGLEANLTCANVGDIYNFEYLQPVQGDGERHLVKVIGTKILTSEDIQRLDNHSKYRRYDTEFMRTNHLITGQSADGTIRNFYAERTRNVRRPLLGGIAFKTGLARLLF